MTRDVIQVDKKKVISIKRLVNRFIAYLGAKSINHFFDKYGINRASISRWRQGRLNDTTLFLLNVIVSMYKRLSIEDRLIFDQELKKMHIDKLRQQLTTKEERYG